MPARSRESRGRAAWAAASSIPEPSVAARQSSAASSHASPMDLKEAAIEAAAGQGLQRVREIVDGIACIVAGIIDERLDQPDAKKGFILDGFPRTLAQAEALDAMLARKGLKLDAAIELKVDAQKLVSRIVNRAVEAKAAGKPVRKTTIRKSSRPGSPLTFATPRR